MFAEPGRHFWRPSGDSARHAFRGHRWCGEPSGTAVCGAEVPLGEVCETEWVMAPSCADCNAVLRGELPSRQRGTP